MANSYWSRVLSNRISRRRALASSGATGLGAALLAACGGGGGGGSEGTDRSGLLGKVEDTSAKAVAGGIWQDSVSREVPSLDPNTTSAGSGTDMFMPIYSLFLKYGRGTNDRPPPNEAITGDAAESWELSPDAMQLTLRLRRNHKFDPRPPTNGRAMTTEDVKWSWDRTASQSPLVAELLASRSPTGPIESLSTPDDKTVVMKLAFPYLAINTVLAYHLYFYILPTEAADKFNPKSEGRGSGPFFLKEWKPSVAYEYTRNPDWYEKGRPFLDGMNRTIIADYSAGLAQFEAKAIWSYGVRPEDILRVKRDHPEMVMLPSAPGLGSAFYFPFSLREDSPFRDVRLRRAASMLVDRDLWIAAEYNTDEFSKAGLPVATFWSSHLPTGYPLSVDPKGKDLGEGAKYFQYDVAEAHKLMSAAGYDASRTLSFWYEQATAATMRRYDTMGTMIAQGGFNLDVKPLVYPEPWRTTCQNSDGLGFDGLCLVKVNAPNEESILTSVYTPEGAWSFTKQPIPGITDLVKKARTETDQNRQNELLRRIQRDLAVQMPTLPMPGNARGFRLNWPWLKNYGVFTEGGSGSASSSRLYTEYWYDASAKTG